MFGDFDFCSLRSRQWHFFREQSLNIRFTAKRTYSVRVWKFRNSICRHRIGTSPLIWATQSDDERGRGTVPLARSTRSATGFPRTRHLFTGPVRSFERRFGSREFVETAAKQYLSRRSNSWFLFFFIIFRLYRVRRHTSCLTVYENRRVRAKPTTRGKPGGVAWRSVAR